MTPTETRYNVQHFGIPDPVYPHDWKARVTGNVKSSIKITLEELQKMPSRTVRALTECAGNDMAFFDYQKNGGEKPQRFDFATMGAGAASGGEFTGVSLSRVLEKAGLKPGTVAVRVQGFDEGAPNPAPGARKIPEKIRYDKALPLDKAMDADTILAWALNGEYLRHVHGAPVRLVVPGWTGNWWVKWVDEIEVCAEVPWVYYQSEYYYRSQSPEDPNREVIYELGVKSAIIDPREGDKLERGLNMIRGFAWSGKGPVVRVDISFDDGKSWKPATLEEPREKWLWTRFYYEWNVDKPGKYSILARAVDASERVQPTIKENRWNHLKKNFEGMIPVDVEVT